MRLRATRLTAIASAVRRALPVFSPSELFASGAPGVWYDFADFSGLFQDSAGTTPVTAVEQPVGLLKDKSGRDNHAFQTTSANRPVLSARYNLLTKTEQFDDVVWVKTSSTVAANTTETTDPLGGNTADKITSSGSDVLAQVVSTVASGQSCKETIYAKKGNFDWIRIAIWDGSGGSAIGVNQYRVWVNLATGAKGVEGTVGTATLVSASVTNAGNGWYRCSITGSLTSSGGYAVVVCTADGDGSVNRVSGGNFYIWGADLRVANDGVNLPPYQRVNTATDYDTVGFPLYLRFNGSTQFLQTNSIDFSSTDKVLVAAGVRKLSDSTAATVAELSANSGVTPNTFAVFAPGAVAPNYAFRSSGTSDSVATATTFASPITNVLVGLGEVASDTAILRINGTQAASSTADQGTGNLGNYSVFIGARAGTSLFFNGRLYSLIIAGIKPTDAQILGVETYINSLTRAF